MLNSILPATGITLPVFLICTAVSLVLGLGSALLCMYKSSYTQSFLLTLAMLPAVVQVVIMLVNGNIGAGVAVAGAFSLVRFRSVPGTAKEIGMIFLAMAIGLASGMGYVVLAALFFVIMAVFVLLLSVSRFGAGKENERELKITIPENLDYEGLFDDLFQQYALFPNMTVRQNIAAAVRDKSRRQTEVAEKLRQFRLEAVADQKPGQLSGGQRCRNGNLNIVCGRVVSKEALL